MMSLPLADLPAAIASILFAFLTSNGPVTSDRGAPTAKPAAQEKFERVAETLADSERFWTAPYVLADLEGKEVYILGEHAGMVSGEPLEFYVISQKSGHDYESLMVSFAAPSDIQTALEKIGAKPGGSVDPNQHRFWPRGDRIAASFLYADGKIPHEARAESFCLWNGNPMPEMPWVFCGAPTLPHPREEGVTVFGPDEFSPNSIASTFNLRNTVFDLPLQGTKTSVYGQFILDPEWKLAKGRPMILRLRPAPVDSYPVEVDVRLRISADELTAEGLADAPVDDLAEVGSLLHARSRELHYLTVEFADDLTVEEATARAREVQLMEQHVESIRIEPPSEGHAFFQSFVPDPGFRVREDRPSQPLELHLLHAGDTTKGIVMELTETWGDSRRPTVTEARVAVETPEAWIAYLNGQEEPVQVLFLYVPRDLRLSEMRKWTRPVLDRFPIVFVYKHRD